ncbi:tyrosine-type recombinase/integrase [Ligilactobacillus ruminis]|uniref:tyrosine-type recombinase/integrase n=1 Tax=Ligilactobacillus ruminis TaxID=1623 RepID=UPI0018C8A79C
MEKVDSYTLIKIKVFVIPCTGSIIFNTSFRSIKVQMPVITPHVCRHTYCTNMAKSGMNPKALQYLMGHSEISVTLNTYTHVNLEDAREEIARIQVV